MNKYDKLNKDLKKERDLVAKKNTQTNAEVDKLLKKIALKKHNRNIFCKKHNDRINDLVDLIENEVERINKDYNE
jgi:hypothetical protein